MSASQDLSIYLALNQMEGQKQSEIKYLLSKLNEPGFSLKNRSSYFQKQGFSDNMIQKIQTIDWKKIEEEVTWSEKPNHHIVTIFDTQYPKLLHEISGPPIVLFVSGEIDCINNPQLAIVGSRKPTPSGREIAYEFAKDLAQLGLVITSGLALGIDGQSHQGALKTGKTIAVLGTGLDNIYPPSHRNLAEKIQEQGALISEFSFRTQIRKINFPKRNRIISGLSKGVLVVEAAAKSGSLITAKFAMEQNRDVFAIPGSIRSHFSVGCHELIKQGAKLVNSIEDIINEYEFLKPNVPKGTRLKRQPLEKNQERLLSYIGFEITPIDIIMVRSNFSIQELSSMLLLLELKGYLKSVPGGYCKT